MPPLSVHDVTVELEEALPSLRAQLKETLDFAQVERALTALMGTLMACVLTEFVEELFGEPGFVAPLKDLGARCGFRLKEYRVVRLRLGLGQVIEVHTPYFLKAAPKRGRRKRGPNGRGCYLGLEVLGFIERCSAMLISDVVQLVLLSPSFEVAHRVLAQRGIELQVKTLRRLCQGLAQRGLAERGPVSFEGTETLRGLTPIIGIDGGRMRERRAKRGRKPKGQKRQGYHSEWKEPKLFTLYAVDAEGKVVKEFDPLHDATLGDHEALFALLERYLDALDLDEVSRVVFCGDGAPWIWGGVEALLGRGGLASARVYQVLDYTHAKQNLHHILDLLPKRLRTTELEQRWKTLLWQGEIAELGQEITQTFPSKSRRQRALRKWESYFVANADRMQYQAFEAQGLPCGSGCVESAIRRVINLRLKAPGTFWTPDMGESVLFLRSQLLSGRWEVLLHNLTTRTAKQMRSDRVSKQTANDYELPQAA